MRMFTRILAAFALVLALAGAATAQGLTPEQQQALSDRVASFDTAMKANDMKSVMGVVPPKVLDKIAATYNVTIDELLVAMQQQMDEAMKSVTIVSFGMDLPAAEYITLADGTTYAMIPTETVIDLGANGGKMKATSKTLGLLDGETWYLVRVDDPAQATMLKEIYPAFADVEFPPAVTEPVTE